MSSVVCNGYVKYEEAQVDTLAVENKRLWRGGPCGIQEAVLLGKDTIISRLPTC